MAKVLVDRELYFSDDWEVGNSMVFYITGDGQRIITSYDGDPDKAPVLHIEYVGESASIPATITIKSQSASTQNRHALNVILLITMTLMVTRFNKEIVKR